MLSRSVMLGPTTRVFVTIGLLGNWLLRAEVSDREPGLPDAVVLTNVAAVRNLSREEAGRSYPVRLQGVVTHHNPVSQMTFVADATGGIYVLGPRRALPVKTGDLVDLEGTSAPGDYHPIIVRPKFTVQGEMAPLPMARLVSFEDLASGEEDCQRVQVKGVVQSVRDESARTVVWLRQGGRKLKVIVPRSTGIESVPEDWVDAEVAVEGLCATSSNRNHELTEVYLCVNGWSDIAVEKRALEPAFDRSTRKISQLGELAVEGATAHRVRVQGVVTNQPTGGSVIIEDGTGSVRFQTDPQSPIQVGDRLDVLGFVTMREHGPELEGAVFRGLLPARTDPTRPTAEAKAEYLPVLTSILQIRSLSGEEANRGYPVRLRAVVTHYDAAWDHLFVQDGKAGIYISPAEGDLGLNAGDLVEIEGFSDPGAYAPIIHEARARVVGKKELPSPVTLTYEQMLGGQGDSQWMEIRAVVQSVIFENGHWTLDLAAGGGHFQAFLPATLEDGISPNLVDAAIRMKAVCATVYNEKQQLVGVKFFGRTADLEIEKPAPDDAFSMPVRLVSALMQFDPRGIAQHRVRLRGVVTHTRGKGSFFMQDDSGGVYITQSEGALALNVGDRVEAVGFPVPGQFSAVLKQSLVRRTSTGAPLAPAVAQAKDLERGARDSEIVQIEAVLLDRVVSSYDHRLLLESDQHLFHAHVEAGPAGESLRSLRAGSRLRVTGICSVQADELRRPRAFRLLVQSPESIAVLSAPPWWNSRRIFGGIAAMAGVVLAALAWAVLLRRKVQEQTEVIRARLEQEAHLERRFQAFMENNPAITFIKDEEGRYLYANEQWQLQFPDRRNDWAGKTDFDFWPEETARVFQESDRAALRSDKTVEKLECGPGLDGEPRYWMTFKFAVKDSEGRRAVGGMALDVTDRHRAEEALRQSEELFSRAFRSSPVPISIATLAEGRYVDANDSFLKLAGFTREEVLGRTSLELKVWDNPADRATVVRAIEETHTVRNLDLKLRTKCGEVRNVLASGELIKFGQQSCLLFILHDITERHTLEAQLRQAQKMEAVGQLAAGVAHDFNNILTVIQMHTSLCLAAPQLIPELANSLSQISLAAERATNLTRQLLTFSRKQIMQAKPLDVNEVIGHVLKMLQRILGEDIALQYNFCANLPAVKADAGMIEQVIINLAVNARDAMPKGGQLSIGTSLVEMSPAQQQQHPEIPSGRFVCLTVGDTGCGMDQATLARIFEPFFTTKEVGKGTGLGLATVYGIVRQHQGWIDVQSEPGRGTVFKTFLPASEVGVERPLMVRAEPELRGGNETVLVVEDEPALRELVRSILEQYGYRILVAATGVEAVKAWDQQTAPIDLLLTDMIMPNGMSGWELSERLKADISGLKVIYTSGYSVDLVGKDCVLREGLNFLQKPYHPHKLVRTVRECLDGKSNGESELELEITTNEPAISR
jgi:PAS domain S-box-containing protein